MYNKRLFNYLDRIYIPLYVLDNVNFIYHNIKCETTKNYLYLLIGSAITAVSYSMYRRLYMSKKERDNEPIFTLTTATHLYSHYILITVYLHLCVLQNNFDKYGMNHCLF